LPDIIQLLPDNVANQIAAGEVIQRPASAVKELLENAVDAGATQITLILKEAGKELIQVIDNGKGMSETDARLCFEKHATSKINTIDDLFALQTMGFRGEALASIAAVAQVELKTKTADNNIGTVIHIADSKVISQEPTSAPTGTSLSIKNLFFSIPARKQFLKSNSTELKNCLDEFVRVALAFPAIGFALHHNGQLLYQLTSGNLKQRILQYFGNNLQNKLLAVQEQTDYLTISGFIGKPEAARKTRGDQYFIVNNRYIRSAYLHHSVMAAFSEFVEKDYFPFYIINITINPQLIDVNVHPTKQEIKFEDDKIVYAFLNAAIKHALAQNSIAPPLQFDLDAQINQLDSVTQPFSQERQTSATTTNLFNTFTKTNQAHAIQPTELTKPSWTNQHFKPKEQYLPQQPISKTNNDLPYELAYSLEKIQANRKGTWFGPYIFFETENELMLIHTRYAQERLLYNQLQKAQQGNTTINVQPSLFPEQFELPAGDAALLNEELIELKKLGYHIESFGGNSFIVYGTPAHASQGFTIKMIEELLEQIKHEAGLKLTVHEKMLRYLAMQQALQAKPIQTDVEMNELLFQLLNGAYFTQTPRGQVIIKILSKQEINNWFK
jgi:DNA mismatch repair protein MutL